jgi:DNA-binding MarR family transcriptional regulator
VKSAQGARITRRGALLRALTEEVVGTFHRLRAISESLHGEGEASAGRRGVLRGLVRIGPQTVPDMARARPVSRQYMQVLVDGLIQDGLVELVNNPAHARSHLVKITAEGRKFLDASDAKEVAIFDALAAGFDARELERATILLRSVRDALARHEGP